MDDERNFYETQLRASEDNLRDLEDRVREYEEMLDLSNKSGGSGGCGDGNGEANSNNSNNSSSSSNNNEDKLSTIAETASLEGQVSQQQQVPRPSTNKQKYHRTVQVHPLPNQQCPLNKFQLSFPKLFDFSPLLSF